MANTATLTGIANVIIPAADQRRMLQFYAGVLGLEKRLDGRIR